MAEVQRRLEAITVELEELARLNFFTPEECTSLVKKQFEFENKINSMNKSVQDFKEYISYLVALYRIILIRRNKVKIGDRKHNLEYRVLQRVKHLYELAAVRFPQDLDLYFEFFQLCKEASYFHATNKMCNMLIKYNKSSEEAWLAAARLYFHEKSDSSKAIQLLQQAIGILNTSALYFECIQYEVYSVIINQKASKTEMTEEMITKLVAKVEIYIKQAKKRVDNHTFYTDLLTFLKKFSFSNSIQVGIIDYLMETSESAECWHYLANRELEGIHYDAEKREITRVFAGKTFINAIGVYEKGLNVIPRQNLPTLWCFYIQCIIDFKSSSNFEKVTNYPRVALNAFERAADKKCLSDEFYLHYLDLVNDNKKVELLKQANINLPKSLDLWILRLRIDIARKDTEVIKSTFETVCKQLGDEACPIWEAMLDFKVESSGGDENILKSFYLSAIEEGGHIGESFQVKYVLWLAGKSMDECRVAYKELLKHKSLAIPLYETMIQLEHNAIMKLKGNKNFEHLEAVHQDAITRIGNDINIWVNYIKFLLKFHPISVAKPMITKVVLQSRRKLNDKLICDFEEKCDELLKASAKKSLKRKFT